MSRTVTTNSCTGTTVGAWDKRLCTNNPVPVTCEVHDVYLPLNPTPTDLNNGRLLDLVMNANTASSTYCTGSTANQAFYYRCSAGGVPTKYYTVMSGCKLFY